MSWKQLVKPRLTVNDGAGWCLRHTQSVYAAPVAFPSAWAAWQGQKGRHTGAHPKNVSVPVWFEHYGTYGAPARWGNWGHVASYVPGRGYLSSPLNGFGRAWFTSISALERSFNAKYVGWSTHMNGKAIVAKAPAKKPTPQPRKDAPVRSYNVSYSLANNDPASIQKGKRRYLRTGPNGNLAVRIKRGGQKLRKGPTTLESHVRIKAGANGLTFRLGFVRGTYNAKRTPTFNPQVQRVPVQKTLAPGETIVIPLSGITNLPANQDLRLFIDGVNGSGVYEAAAASGFQW